MGKQEQDGTGVSRAREEDGGIGPPKLGGSKCEVVTVDAL